MKEFIRFHILTLIILLFAGSWTNSVWGRTWTWKVTVGVASGKGTATAEVIKCPLIGSEYSEKSCSSTSTTTSSTSASENHALPSSNTNRRYKFTASASNGYSFAGWYTSTSVSGTASSTDNPLTGSKTNSGFDETRYAKFTPNTYTVKFDKNTGSGTMSNQTFTYDKDQNLTANSFTKTGYTFAGWATSKDGNVVYSNGQSVKNLATSGTVTLYAKWTANTYYVAFNGNGATSGSMSNQAFTYDAAEQALTANSYGRQHTVSYNANGGTTASTSATNTTSTYTFVNWNTEANGSGTPYKNQYSGNNLIPSGTLTLYAQWSDANAFVKLPNATKTGSVLDAWYLGDVNVEANRVGAAGDNYTPTANVTLTAKWIDKYTPEFGGSDHEMKVGDVLSNAFTFNHTSNPVAHISPAGIISYDATNNKVTATGEGEATIYFTQTGTSTILPGESDHWTFTVTRVANTLALTSTSASKYVDEEVTGIIQTTNSDAQVQTSSSDATIAYYDVAKNKIVIPNSEAKSFASTTVTIEIWQDQTVKYKASGKKIFTLTVNKYLTSFSGSDYNLMVDGSQVANYVYTNTSANQPTANSSDNFYYTIDEVSFTKSAKNKGANLVTFNPSNKQITACNAGTGKISLHQRETYKFRGAEKSFNVAVYKYNSVFANASNLNVKVDANVNSSYTLSYVKPNNSYISTESVVSGTPSLNSGDFYYTLSHNVTTSNTTGSSDATKAIAYVASSKTVTGKNAGTATVHLYQTETYKFNPADVSFNVNVTKHDPTFTWNNGSTTYYHNTSIANVFSSTNKDCAYTIGASTDANVAKVEGNTLYVLSKNGSASFTVSQAENYKWNGKEQTFTVTPMNQSNHVEFTYTNEMYNDGSITTQKVTSAWDNSNQVQLGETGSAFDWDDKYIIIKFKGIPDKLNFKHCASTKDVSNGYTAYRQADWYVAESSDGTNFTNVWSNMGGSNSNSTSWQTISNVSLSSSTRYIKLCYSGNFAGYFKDINVTELTKFAANKSSLDFGANEVNDEVASQTFGLKYANAGHNITLTTNDDHFTVSPTTITSIGGEKTGTYTPITVSYNTASVHTSNGAKLTIQDELGNKTTVNLSGTTNKRQPTVTWSSNADYFNVDDELSATNANGLAVTLSSEGNDSYVHCEGNTATMIEATSGTITITAHVTGNAIYADKDFTKTITITNKEKQTISWDQDFSRLKTTDDNKSITLNATTSASGLKVSYELQGDQTGLSLTQNGDVWTLTYSATECKNTTIVAKQAGNGTYAPASSVAKTVKVIDPTKVCDTNETLVNSTVTLKETSTTYNIDIPHKMYVSVSRTKTSWAIYLVGVDFEFYSGRNGTGTKLYTKSYRSGDIDKSITNSEIDLSSYIHAKSVKVVTTSTNGYNINGITYTKRKYCNISTNSLAFSTYPNTQTVAQNFNVEYANYPISLECSNPKFSFTPASFGDCSEYGTQSVSVTYTAGEAEGNDVGYLYIKDNTSKTLQTCTLNVTISKVAQSITTHNIQTSYLTTDKVTLTAESNSHLTDFTYSASPAGVAVFNGSEMTFTQSGTIAITATQAGNNVYSSTSTTVNGVVVSKVTPEIATNPTGTDVVYNQTLNKSTLSGGAAETTFRGVAHTEVAGTFAWTNPTQTITDNAGEQSYSVTFTPENRNMYNSTTFTIPIIITRASQSIAMNNGAVKVSVDGLDAGSADSKIDLDDLIQSQSSEVVGNVERTGSVSYAVISDNKTNATIGEGNIFSATAVGEYTIRATKAETDYYAQATSDFTVTVGMRANTLAISGTAFEKYVDEEVTTIRSAQNSDAQVKTSSTSPTIAYYDVDNNKIVIPNGVSEEQMFGNQKTVTITIWQDATDRFEASGVKTITLTVKKYVASITGSDYILKVNGTQTADYTFANTSTSIPSSNLTDEFYYTIDEPNFDNEALNNGDELVSFNPNTNEIRGLNAGTTKITFFQKETYKYTAATKMCNIAVEKKANAITNTWKVWQKAMNESESADISFASTLGDYTNYPIAIERVYGEDVASLSGDASAATITTNTTHGYAIWHLSQAENYEYYSAEADLMVTVGVPAPPTCYVYEDYTEHEFETTVWDAEGKFETPIEINSPIDKIWYKAKKSSWGYNYFVVQYSTDNGKTWSTVSSPDLGDEYVEYSATFPAMSGNKKITHVRFGAKTGGTLSKWYKDVKISRKAHFNIHDAEQKNISSLPTMVCTIDETSTAEAKFYIDYSTCAEEILIQSSNPEHFTVSRTKIDITPNSDNTNSAKEEITVTYNSAELGTHNAVITVRTEYQTRALSVSGETTKRTPTLTWQEGYTNNPLNLPIGLTVTTAKPAAKSTSTAAVMYESSNENVLEIIDNGYGFRVIGLGSATLTAVVPENDKWKSVSDTRVIHATEKTVQEIVWDQNFPRFMEPGDVIDLDAKVYLRNMSTNELIYSAERTPYINYTCPTNNGIVSVSGTKMTVLDYGEVKVTASVGGNADYAAAASVIMLINVRQPSVGCETPLVLNRTDIIDMFEVNVDFSNYFNLTTEEMISNEIAINPAQGKPDKLSFQYGGEVFKVPVVGTEFFGGYVKFEQRVNGSWIAVTNSRVETVKNEWNTLSNLQLDENADALRIIREKDGTGHHKIKDIQVTLKQYLRATQAEINLGVIKKGDRKSVNVGFEYSDIKGDLTARTINETTGISIEDNGVIDLDCGSFGHYDLPVTFTPDQEGEWEGTIEVFDNIANMSITVTLTATVTANDEYIFNKEGDWNKGENWSTNQMPENANVTVAQDANINVDASVKSITIDEGVTVTVKSGVTLVVGDGSPKDLENYGNLYVEDGGQVILNDGSSLPINNFILEASIGSMSRSASSGQVQGEGSLDVNGNAYFQITFDPDKISYGWYDFVVPFDVDVIGGIYLPGDTTTPLQNGNGLDYLVMEYDEEKRASGANGWVWFTGTMQAGKLYTITLDETKPERTTYLFKRKADAQIGGNTSIETSYTPSSTKSTKNSGWNGLGNGTLQHCQLNSLPDQAKIQIFDHENNCYVERNANKYTYAIGTAFFLQVDGETPTVELTPDTADLGFLVPARNGRETTEFCLSLTAEGEDIASDHFWFSASEEATEEYVIGRDLLKMGSPTSAKVARMWTVKGEDKLCDIEATLVNDNAETSLSFYTPQTATYELNIERAPENTDLYLTYNGRIIWDLTASPYVFDLTKGTTEGYGLLMDARSPYSTTGVDNIDAEGQTMRKVLIDNVIYIITPEGAMYDVTGKIAK